jgi:hypothetical protein
LNILKNVCFAVTKGLLANQEKFVYLKTKFFNEEWALENLEVFIQGVEMKNL